MNALLAPFTTRHGSSSYIFDQVHIPLILKGSINRSVYAGHMKLLGIEWGWNEGPQGWTNTGYLSLWGIVAFHYENTKGGTLKSCKPGLTINWMKITLKAAVHGARKY